MQDRQTVKRGVFDEETPAEELTQVRMGRIVADRYPDLSEDDREAVRQHAVAAIAMTQKGKANAPSHDASDEPKANTAFVDGVRQYVTDVKDLVIDLIDRINPFQTARAILSKSMDEATLKEVAAIIAKKRINLTHEEARGLAERAVRFKQEQGRLPSLTSNDAWERQMAEGVAFLQKKRRRMSDRSDLDILSDLGLEPIEKKTANSPREARIIAGFEDIQKFFEEHGRAPRHGADHDIFERLYAVRLDRLRSLEECRSLLTDIDTHELLSGVVADAEDSSRSADLNDDELPAALGAAVAEPSGLTDLRCRNGAATWR